MTRRTAQCGTRSGFRRHQREGTTPCGMCRSANREYQNRWDRAHRRLDTTPSTVITPAQHAHNTAEYDAFVRERRRRGIPENGVAA